MIIDIIHSENKHAIRGGMPHISMDELYEWSGGKKAMVDDLLSICASFNKYISAEEAALSFKDKYTDMDIDHTFIMYINYKVGAVIFADINLETIDIYCETIAESCYNDYILKFDKTTSKKNPIPPSSIRKIVDYYLKFMVDNIEEVLELKYDWSIIQAALWFDLSHQRFNLLKTYVASCSL